MPDLSKVSRGDPVKLDAATFNTILESADDFARRRRSGAEPSPTNDPHVGATLGLVRWDGAAIPAGSVVGYGAAVIAPADDPPAVRRRYVWIGTTPADASDPFAITIEPIPSGGYGRAAVLGQTVVDIDVTDEAHTHAVPIAGDSAKLASAVSGPAAILSKPSGTGVLRCEVLIGAGGGDGCAGSVCTDYWSAHGGYTGIPYMLLAPGQTQIIYETATDVPENVPVVIQAGITAGPGAFLYPSWGSVWGRLTDLNSSGTPYQFKSNWVPLGTYVRYANSSNFDPNFLPDQATSDGSWADPSRQGCIGVRRTFPHIGGTRVAWEVMYRGGTLGGALSGNFVKVFGIGSGPTYIITMTCCGTCDPTLPTSSVPAPPPPIRTPDPAAPVAKLEHSPLSGPAPLAVTFIDTSTGTPTARAYDFGDGTGSTEQHPAHTYYEAGNYTVVMTARNAHGASVARADVIVYEAGAIGEPTAGERLQARFRAVANAGVAPFAAMFEDLTEGGELPLEYRVNYGDGAASGAAASLPTTHEYTSAGTYTLTLTVVDAVGNVSAATETITVGAGEWGDGSLAAGIGYGPPLGGPPYTAFFVDNSSTSGGPITSWAWDFGDGGTSALQNPVSHDYAGAGTYTVRLTVTSATDADTYEQVITIP